MQIVKINLPALGESIYEATVIKWLKNKDDVVQENDYLLEIATDKIDTEIPSPYNGKIKNIVVKPNDVVQVGKPICEIEVDENEYDISEIKNTIEAKKNSKTKATEFQKSNITEQQTYDEQYDTKYKAIEEGGKNTFLSPLVRRIIKEENITNEEVVSITGTGLRQRVTKDDIIAYVNAKRKTESVSIRTESVHIPLTGEEEIVKMDRMREMIAERMLVSSRLAPHVTSFIEADVTNIVRWRNDNKDLFQKKYGDKLTYTPIFAEIIAKAIKEYPMINISIRGNEIIKRPYINLGMAVALKDGNLIAPVIKDADKLSLNELAYKINETVVKAREGNLSSEDISGGTYTFSNIGVFENIMGTPIIVQPQVAILALGVIEKKPAVITEHGEDVIAIRHKMFISHSYDHRVVDGALGGMFIKTVADYLSGFDLDRKV